MYSNMILIFVCLEEIKCMFLYFFFSSRIRHTRWPRDWSSDVCSSDLGGLDEHLQYLITLYRQGDLPKGLPYEIRETVLRLTAFVNEPEASARVTSEDSES